jgi:hypothetical protein
MRLVVSVGHNNSVCAVFFWTSIIHDLYCQGE